MESYEEHKYRRTLCNLFFYFVEMYGQVEVE